MKWGGVKMAYTIRLDQWKDGILPPELENREVHRLLDDNSPEVIRELLENGCNPHEVAFLQAKSAVNFPDTTQTRVTYYRQQMDMLHLLQDNRLDSWITELIQNSQDSGASNLILQHGPTSVHFSHDGERFKGNELTSLFSMYSTTKNLDVRSIGRFGIGFKYWMNFFNSLEVQTRNNNDRFRLRISHTDPGDDSGLPTFEYDTVDVGTNYSTIFKFSDVNDNTDPQSFSTETFLQDRVPQSLPLLLDLDTGEFSFRIVNAVADGETRDRTLRSSSDEVHLGIEHFAGVRFHKIQYGFNDDTPDRSCLRFSFSNSWIEEHMPVEYSNLKQQMIHEYIETQRRYGQRKTIQEATNVVESGLDDADGQRTLFNIVYLLEEPPERKGYFSSRFIADRAQIDIPFLFDAPFRLDVNRLDLNLNNEDRGMSWNRPTLQICGKLYNQVLEWLLECQGEDLFQINLDGNDIDRLINLRLGSQSNPNLNRLIRTVYDDFNIPPSQLATQEMTSGASEELLRLWRGLSASNDEVALNWFFEALDPRIAYIQFANERTLIGSTENFPEHEGSVFVRNYGEGVPESISILRQQEYEVYADQTQDHFFDLLWSPVDEAQNEAFFTSELNNRDASIFLETPPAADGPLRALLPITGQFTESPQVYVCSQEEIDRERLDEDNITIHTEVSALQTLLIKIFEESQNQEQELLQEQNYLAQVQEILEGFGDEGVLERMMIRKESGVENWYLIRLPELTDVTGIISGVEQFSLVSIKSNPRLNALQVTDNPPKIILWGSDVDRPLWFVSDETPLPQEPEYTPVEEGLWEENTLEDAFVEYREWNWVKLERVGHLDNLSKDFVFIDSFVLMGPDDEQQIHYRESGLFSNVYTRNNQHEYELQYSEPHRYASNQTISGSRLDVKNTPVSKSIVKAAVGYTDRISYQYSQLHFNPNRVKPYALLRARGRIQYYIEQNVEMNVQEKYALVKMFDEKVHSAASFFDVFWSRKNPSAPWGLKLCSKRIQASVVISTTATNEGGLYVPRLLASNWSRDLNVKFLDSVTVPRHLYEVCGGIGSLPYPVINHDELTPNPVFGINSFPVPEDSTLLEKLRSNTIWQGEVLASIRTLVENVQIGNPNANDALIWLDRLAKADITFWLNLRTLDTGSGVRLLRIELRESGLVDPEIYPHLYPLLAHGAAVQPWTAFVEAVTNGLSVQQARDIFANTVVPIFVNGGANGVEISYEGGPILSSILETDIFFNSKLVGRSLLYIEENTRVLALGDYSPQIRNLLFEVEWLQEVNQKPIHEVLVQNSHADTIQIGLPERFKWLEDALTSLEPPVAIRPLNVDNEGILGIHYGRICPSFSLRERRLTVHPPLDHSIPLDIAQVEQLWTLLNNLLMESDHAGLDNLIDSHDLIGPWSWQGNEDPLREQFMEMYCSHQGNFAQQVFDQYLNANEETLVEYLNTIRDMYRSNNTTLMETKRMLKSEIYTEGHPSMVDEFVRITTSTSKITSLLHWTILPNAQRGQMIQFRTQSAKGNLNSMGEYLLLNSIESEAFIASDGPGCVFVDNFEHLFLESLSRTVREDPENEWIYVDDAITYQGGTLRICFHKVHLMTVIGWLIAGGVLSAE